MVNSDSLAIYEVIDNSDGIFIPDITNHQKHLYPYLAAFITVSCLSGAILVIICINP